MRLQGTAARLTIVVDEMDACRHGPVYAEIVQRARHAGLAGATAIRGTLGFAGGSAVHRPHLFHVGDHLPVVITIVDSHARIDAFLPDLRELLGDKGLVLLDDVEVVRYTRDRES
jgi:uncharacterized protein